MLILLLLKSGGWAMLETILKSIGCLTLLLLASYVLATLKYLTGEKSAFYSLELFSKEKSFTGCSLDPAGKLQIEERVVMLKTWILLHSKKDTALPKWFLEEMNIIQTALSGRDMVWLQGIKNEIYLALLAKNCKAKASEFHKKFICRI